MSSGRPSPKARPPPCRPLPPSTDLPPPLRSNRHRSAVRPNHRDRAGRAAGARPGPSGFRVEHCRRSPGRTGGRSSWRRSLRSGRSRSTTTACPTLARRCRPDRARHPGPPSRRRRQPPSTTPTRPGPPHRPRPGRRRHKLAQWRRCPSRPQGRTPARSPRPCRPTGRIRLAPPGPRPSGRPDVLRVRPASSPGSRACHQRPVPPRWQALLPNRQPASARMIVAWCS